MYTIVIEIRTFWSSAGIVRFSRADIIVIVIMKADQTHHLLLCFSIRFKKIDDIPFFTIL